MRHSLRSCCVPVVQVYLQPCRRNSLMKCVPQPKILKNTQTLYFKSLRSFKVIDVDTVQKLVTSAYDKQYVCVHLQLFSRQSAKTATF